jgi:hypothetical protein
MLAGLNQADSATHCKMQPELIDTEQQPTDPPALTIPPDDLHRHLDYGCDAGPQDASIQRAGSMGVANCSWTSRELRSRSRPLWRGQAPRSRPGSLWTERTNLREVLADVLLGQFVT